MLVYLPLFNITLPGNISSVMAILIDVATFDVVPQIDNIIAFMFTFENSADEITQNGLTGIGFENKNFIVNSGSLFIYMAAFVSMLVLSKIFRRLALRSWDWIPCYRRVRFNINVWPTILRFVLEGYLEFFFSALLQMEVTSKIGMMFNTFGDALAYSAGLTFFLLCAILPYLVAHVLSRKIVFLDYVDEMENEIKPSPALARRTYTRVAQFDR